MTKEEKQQQRFIEEQLKGKTFSFHVYAYDGKTFEKELACSVWVTAFDEENAIAQARMLVQREHYRISEVNEHANQ